MIGDIVVINSQIEVLSLLNYLERLRHIVDRSLLKNWAGKLKNIVIQQGEYESDFFSLLLGRFYELK